ncbi:DNA-binding SARP family transcriptional activator [Naumannella cuiyingiana]|uniref:DNA-binding SARP family transcriptional activator n=1 Tax=Naumannella cuiyingiana TaxID=1347891 RepID=A0A7Z0D9T6_9ACTN|nr:DNA-binding SARP family transcriptional activator [Naumannella cuiyingiana]
MDSVVEPPKVVRRRLVDEIRRFRRSVLIEAGGGLGKTQLLEQLIAADGGVLIRLARDQPADHATLVAELKATTGSRSALADIATARQCLTKSVGCGMLAVDNVEMLTDDAAEWLAELTRCGGSLRVLISSRVLPDPLAALEFQGDAERFNTQDLLFDEMESDTLARLQLGDEDGQRLGPMLHSLSGGWVALLQIMVRRLMRSADRMASATMLVQNSDLIRQLIDHYAADLDHRDRLLMAQVAAFPQVNDRLMAHLGEPGLLRRLLGAGIPFAVGADGWSRLCQEARNSLTATAPLDPDLARRGAPLLVSHRAEAAAATLLVESGLAEDAAELLGSLPTSGINRIPPAEFVSLVASLGRVAESSPRVLMHLARAHRNLGQLAEEREVIDWAFRVTRRHSDELALEVEGELLIQRARLRDSEGLSRVVELLDSGVPEGSRAHASLLEALGMFLALTPDGGTLRRAEDAMRQAAITWGKLAEAARATEARRNLATHVLAASGRTKQGAALLNRLALSSETEIDRMLCLVAEARLQALSGESDRSLEMLEEATSLADLLGIDWVPGHAAWTRMIIAANRGDGSMTLRELAIATAHLGQLINDGGGLLFLCEAADACAMVGAQGSSNRLLEEARDHRVEDPTLVTMTEAFLGARQGEPQAGAALQQMLEAGDIPPGARWKAELLTGYVHDVAGRTASAGASLVAAFDRSAGLGVPDLPERREKRLVDVLRAGLPHGPVTTGSASGDQFEVRVLGEFRIARGRSALVGPGRAEQLVKYLVLTGGSARDEFMAEQMWPGAARGVGQRRLKNVLTRVRQSYPGLVVRSGSTLSLASCVVDLHQFDELAQAAVTARGDDELRSARAALDAFAGPLLPDDVDDEFVDVRREAVRRRSLGLIDVVLVAALRDGDLGEAVRLLERSMALDPYDQERPLRVTQALIADGRLSEAGALASRVLAAAEELGVPPAVEWQGLSADHPALGSVAPSGQLAAGYADELVHGSTPRGQIGRLQ